MSSWSFIPLQLSSYNLTPDFICESMFRVVNPIGDAPSHVDVLRATTLSEVIETKT